MAIRTAVPGSPARTLAALLLVGSFASPGVAKESDRESASGDVSLPERIEVEAQTLVLNGQALRKVALIKIYVAGLYLSNRESRAEAILEADAPRSLMMHFLRDVDADRLCEGWDTSLEKNTPHPSAQLRAQFDALCSWMENARKGDRLIFMCVPSWGTSVEINGKVKGPLAGKEFADALFRTWLGVKAIPGEEFRRRLLGLS